jgi:hypothetical protein
MKCVNIVSQSVLKNPSRVSLLRAEFAGVTTHVMKNVFLSAAER